MTERTPNALNDSSVEVVADQSEDGSYEIRVARTTDRIDAGVVPPASAPAGPPRGRRMTWWIVSGVAGVVAVAVIALAGDDTPVVPALEEPEPIPTFRAYTIQAPQVSPGVRVLVELEDAGLLGQAQEDFGYAAEPANAAPAFAAHAVAAEPAQEEAVPEAPFDEWTAERLARVPVVAQVELAGDEDEDEADDDEDFGEDEELD